MQKIIFLTLFTILITITGSANAENVCKLYPHWDCSKSDQLTILNKFENFIAKHPQKGLVAFDWDGTLYDEHIPLPGKSEETRSCQSVWHYWAANHLSKYPYLFPSFKTGKGNPNEQANNIKRQDDYIEGQVFQPASPTDNTWKFSPMGYDKVVQIASFEAGMSLNQMRFGITQYLKDYSPTRYGFTKMLDLVQRFSDTGFTVWIVTGSNPYYLGNLITAPSGVNASLNYHIMTACIPDQKNFSNFSNNCFISGNGAKIWQDKNGTYKFSSVYDDRFLKEEINENQRSAVSNYGKELVLRQLIKRFNKPLVFYAGNSDGDYYAMKFLLSQAPDTMGVFVQPDLSHSTKFKDLLFSKACKDRCIDMEQPEK